MTTGEVAADLYVPYTKWKKFTKELELYDEAEGTKILAPHENGHVNELGRPVTLQNGNYNSRGIVHVFRALLARLYGPDQTTSLDDPNAEVWWIRYAGAKPLGPYSGKQLSQSFLKGSAAAPKTGAPANPTMPRLDMDTPLQHTVLRAYAPAWLVVEHYRMACLQPNMCNADVRRERLPGDPVLDDDVHMAEVDAQITATIEEALHTLRAEPGYEASIQAMDLDLGQEVQSIPDIMDFAMDADLERTSAVQKVLHLHFVLDSSFLCNPRGLKLLQKLQAAYAPCTSVPKLGGDGSTSRLAVSAVVPRRVYSELDRLKEATGREVGCYARQAFDVILSGIRQRDGFYALQSIQDYRKANEQADEVASTTDRSVIHCAAYMASMFLEGKGAIAPPPLNMQTPTSTDTAADTADVPTASAAAGHKVLLGSEAQRELGGMAEGANAAKKQAADTEGEAAADGVEVVRQVVVLTNDNGMCILAEAENISAARTLDLPHHTSADALERCVCELAATGLMPKVVEGKFAKGADAAAARSCVAAAAASSCAPSLANRSTATDHSSGAAQQAQQDRQWDSGAPNRARQGAPFGHAEQDPYEPLPSEEKATKAGPEGSHPLNGPAANNAATNSCVSMGVSGKATSGGSGRDQREQEADQGSREDGLEQGAREVEAMEVQHLGGVHLPPPAANPGSSSALPFFKPIVGAWADDQESVDMSAENAENAKMGTQGPSFEEDFHEPQQEGQAADWGPEGYTQDPRNQHHHLQQHQPHESFLQHEQQQQQQQADKSGWDEGLEMVLEMERRSMPQAAPTPDLVHSYLVQQPPQHENAQWQIATETREVQSNGVHSHATPGAEDSVYNALLADLGNDEEYGGVGPWNEECGGGDSRTGPSSVVTHGAPPCSADGTAGSLAECITVGGRGAGRGGRGGKRGGHEAGQEFGYEPPAATDALQDKPKRWWHKTEELQQDTSGLYVPPWAKRGAPGLGSAEAATAVKQQPFGAQPILPQHHPDPHPTSKHASTISVAAAAPKRSGFSYEAYDPCEEDDDYGAPPSRSFAAVSARGRRGGGGHAYGGGGHAYGGGGHACGGGGEARFPFIPAAQPARASPAAAAAAAQPDAYAAHAACSSTGAWDYGGETEQSVDQCGDEYGAPASAKHGTARTSTAAYAPSSAPMYGAHDQRPSRPGSVVNSDFGYGQPHAGDRSTSMAAGRAAAPPGQAAVASAALKQAFGQPWGKPQPKPGQQQHGVHQHQQEGVESEEDEWEKWNEEQAAASAAPPPVTAPVNSNFRLKTPAMTQRQRAPSSQMQRTAALSSTVAEASQSTPSAAHHSVVPADAPLRALEFLGAPAGAGPSASDVLSEVLKQQAVLRVQLAALEKVAQELASSSVSTQQVTASQRFLASQLQSNQRQRQELQEQVSTAEGLVKAAQQQQCKY